MRTGYFPRISSLPARRSRSGTYVHAAARELSQFAGASWVGSIEMGLAICASIVEQHNGESGPRVSKAREVASISREDDTELAQVLVTVFQRHNIEASHALTSCKAIELCESLMPDLLVLDLSLADGDGYEVVDWLRERNGSDYPVFVVYTAKDLAGSDRQRLKLGKALFYTKRRTTPEEIEEKAVGPIRQIVDRPQ